MRELKSFGIVAIDLVAWLLVGVLALFAAAQWDPFWGFFPVVGAVLLAWLVVSWLVARRAPTLSPAWRTLAAREDFRDPTPVRWLLANPASAPLWLVIRVFVGWQWLHAGWEKLTGDGWINQNGSTLQGFWQRIVEVPTTGKPAITYGWYRDFIQYMLDHSWYSWFAAVIAVGETVVGIALIVGLLTGLAALAGATMNFNFMLAGSASTNPVLFGAAMLLILAWKVSGWIGLDRWGLPLLGTPWQHGLIEEQFEAGLGHSRTGP